MTARHTRRRTAAAGAQRGFADLSERQLARGLGWFSIGLGVAQIVAPRRISRLIGVSPHPTLMLALGVRELVSGVGILQGRRPSGWLWSRVAGDGMDLAMLATALASGRNARGRVALATAAVAGVTALDLLSSQQVGSHPRAQLPPAALDGVIEFDLSQSVNRSPAECYAFWREFENLPKFMTHLESVRNLSETRSHWVVKAPAGRTVEWDAEITEDRPDEAIGWKSAEGADVENSGTVRFEPGPAGRGTVVRVRLRYRPPAGALGAAVAKLFGEEPRQQAQEDLRRFKRVMEIGEVPTTEGQPAGRRSSVARLFAKVSP